MKVPPGSKAGQKLRLAGKGLPKPGGGAGDLYAMLGIAVPGTLTEAERKLFEELKQNLALQPAAALPLRHVPCGFRGAWH